MPFVEPPRYTERVAVSPKCLCILAFSLVNLRRACAARVTVVVSVCLSVCPREFSHYVPEIWRENKLTRAIHGARAYVCRSERSIAHARVWVIQFAGACASATLDEQAVFEFLSSVSIDLCSR